MGALSKGCGTCKRRRVKCDETHPRCARCTAAGIECTGYAVRIRYVDEASRIRRHAVTAHRQSQDFLTKRDGSHSLFHASRTRQPVPVTRTPEIAPMLHLTAFKDDIFMSFLVLKFFKPKDSTAVQATRQSSCGLPREWTPELTKAPHRSTPRSWDALAAVVFGQAHRSYRAISSALELYSQALSELRVQLSEPLDRYTQRTLASITALYLFQIILSKHETTWMLHVSGLSGILQWMGPRLNTSCAGDPMFLEHRITLVAKAIMSGQSTFLSQSIWKTAPWKDNLALKSAMDYLVDVAADVADYLMHVKRLNTFDTNQDFNLSQLKAQVAASFEELNAWWCLWQTEHIQSARELPSRHPSHNSIFPTLLEYDMLDSAYEVCLYNTIRILLLRAWRILQSFPTQSTNESLSAVLDMPNQTVLLGVSSDIPGLACEILRSLRYCCSKSRRLFFGCSFLFIQEVTYSCFDKESKEAKWMVAQDWSESGQIIDAQDSNLLKRLLPNGDMSLAASGR